MEKQFNEAANKGGIYRIRNKVNGKVYIGSAAYFKQRLYQHQSALRNNKHQNKMLQHAFNKYGEDNFIFEVLEIVEGRSVKKRRTIEEKYIKEIFGRNTCYNVHNKTMKTQGPWSSTPEETRKKLSKAWKTRPPTSKETRERMSKAHKGENHPMYGRQHTEESKRKMSETHKQYTPWNKGKTGIYSKETLKKISEGSKGRKASEETRKKMSASRKGLHAGEKHPHYGKPLSDEHKKKISKANSGKNHWNYGLSPTEETRKKMIESHIGKNVGMKSPRAKVYENIKLKSPDGQIFTKIECLSAFCREHDLNVRNLHSVLKGRRRVHKGWELI